MANLDNILRQESIESRYERALYYMDKLLPLLPSDAHFFTSEFILSETDWSGIEKDDANNVSQQIDDLLLNVYFYADVQNFPIYLRLNDKGREAKRLGGHYCFLKNTDKTNLLESSNLRLENELQIKQIQLTDLQIKEAKNKRVIAIFAFIIGAVVTNFKDILEVLKKAFHK